MFDLPKVFKEITPESTQTDKWKELCFNTGKILILVYFNFTIFNYNLYLILNFYYRRSSNYITRY